MSGGSGLLGTALRGLHPEIVAPHHEEMDILDKPSICRVLDKEKPGVFLHAAAFTSLPRSREKPIDAMEINIVGTANVVRTCSERGIRVVYISTDYVFKGDKGNYKEEDELYPQNYYGWTKLGGECAVRSYDNTLIIRTSFSPDIFPHEKAFIDQFTSRDALSVIAPMIHALILRYDICGIVHVGTERKTVKDLALKLGRRGVGDLYLKDVTFDPPKDTSFDLSKLHSLVIT